MSNLNIRNFPKELLIALNVESARRGIRLRELVIERLSSAMCGVTIKRRGTKEPFGDYERALLSSLDVVAKTGRKATVETRKDGGK